jgi:hypothetical protein
MYSTNLTIPAVVCAGVLTVAYAAGFYPVYVALGSVAVLGYLAFAGGGPKKKANSRPKYLYDD